MGAGQGYYRVVQEPLEPGKLPRYLVTHPEHHSESSDKEGGREQLMGRP